LKEVESEREEELTRQQKGVKGLSRLAGVEDHLTG